MHPLRIALLSLLLVPALASAQVTVSDAWVRGTVPGQQATGAFMKITASQDTTLVAAASPAAAQVELHEMKMDGGMMVMREIGRLALPAGKKIELRPGGLHLMMTGLSAPAAVGAQVPISLTFEDRSGKRSTVEVKATVRPLTATHGSGKH